MKFEFEKPRAETIYDNHGCPWHTEYEMKFTVDDIKFIAKYADIHRLIDLYHDNKLIAGHIKRIGIVDEFGKIKDVIKDAFKKDEIVNKIFHKLKGDTLEVLKEKLCADLLSDDDWS